MNPFLYLFQIFLFLLALTGIDHMVTGKIKPDVERNVFRAYALWVTFLVCTVGFTVASGGLLTTPERLLIFYSYIWCWVGGVLDFLYFMIHGDIPDPDKIWHWIPFTPKTWQWGIYTITNLVIFIIIWGVKILGL